MNKQDQMTMQEAERKMESLREVFQVVRLVDGKMLMDREKRINAGDLSETCQCYSFWKKDKECENCSSLLALKEQTQKIKFEFLDLQVFQVISRYVEIDGRPYVMEMIQNLDESIQIDQEGYDKLISKLSGYNEKLYTDVLTGIYNRRFFEEKIKNMEDEAGIAVIDLDDFKLYNQLYGVKEGDLCLQRIADIIRSSVGESGYTARYGGKEFAVLLPGYDLFSARNMVESIAKQIYVMNNRRTDMKLKAVTVSAGISAAPYAARNVKELMENVDLAVYHVKHNGKNGIQVFDMMFRNNSEGNNTRNHTHIYQEYESTIYALTAAIDAKDHYTFSHSNNVAYYATSLATTLGMNEDMIEIIRQAALLHDVGKIGIPEYILNKEGKLTDEEYEIIKGHVEASIDIIRHLPSLDYVIPAVIGHHERYDGKGYPRRIAGEDIPLTARILCVADSFDAMTSKRCYKKAFSIEVAREKLLQDAGRQFDPDLVYKFVECLDNGSITLVKAEETVDNLKEIL